MATVTYKDDVYTVTLFRGEKIVYELEGYHLLAVPESTTAAYREKVIGPSYDGFLYMFYKAAPIRDYLWLSKEEYETLLPIWDSMQPSWEDSDDPEAECDYCHGAVGICGGSCRDRD